MLSMWCYDTSPPWSRFTVFLQSVFTWSIPTGRPFIPISSQVKRETARSPLQHSWWAEWGACSQSCTSVSVGRAGDVCVGKDQEAAGIYNRPSLKCWEVPLSCSTGSALLEPSDAVPVKSMNLFNLMSEIHDWDQVPVPTKTVFLILSQNPEI